MAWFWWGTAGSEDYKKLWDLMYDRMVNTHGLNNLIWVWNGQHNDKDTIDAWYPGDDTVDIIAEDIYPDKQDYSSQVDQFASAMKYTKTNKIIALSETGVIPDPDQLQKSGNMWSWFAPWYREFVVDMDNGYEKAAYSDEYTSLKMLRKVYNDDRVITLDELPLLNPKANKPEVKEEGISTYAAVTTDSGTITVLPWILSGVFFVTTIGFGVVAFKKKKRR